MSRSREVQVKRVKCTKDLLPKLATSLEKVLNKQVLIGIPGSTADRDGRSDDQITNAQLGYIHEFGAPAANIPPRPFLIPGVEKAEDQAAERLRKALQQACNLNGDGAASQLEAAGATAASSAKQEMGENGPPLKPATIRNRQRGRGTKSKRDSEKHYLRLLAGGVSDAEAQSAAGIRPLVDTSQLLRAITYVVRPRSKPIRIPLQRLAGATTPAIAKGKVTR